MAVLPMKRVQICALKRDRKQIMKILQRRGVVELNDEVSEDSTFQRMDTSAQRIVFEKNVQIAQQALDVLDTYVPVKKPMLAMLSGKEEMPLTVYDTYSDKQDEIMEHAKTLNALAKEIAEYSANIPKLQAQIEALTPWFALDVPQSFLGTKTTAALIGAVPGEVSLEAIYGEIANRCPEIEAVDCSVISSTKDQTCLFVLCRRESASAVEDALRAIGFARPSNPSTVPPLEEKGRLEEEILSTQQKIDQAKEKIAALADQRQALQFAVDYYTMRADRYEALGRLVQSRRTFFLTGYIPEPAIAQLQSAMEPFDCVMELEDPGEEEDVPVLLKNNGFTDPMEGVVAGYSLPGKGEIDPSSIMAIFYYIFFGMMFSDAAYGFVLALATGIILLKCKGMEAGMRKSIKLFFYCGISTIFWGVMFGSYFGDALGVITRTFFGHEIIIPPVWFDPVSNPMKLLLVAFAFGVVHLFTGLAVLLYEKLKAHSYADAIYDVVFWYLLVGGGIVYLVTMPMFQNMFALSLNIPSIVGTVSAACAIIGAVGILFTGGRESRNPIKRLLKGAYALYNVTGYLSDILSYSRLLALGLATSVIATVFNQMGSMIGGNIIGAIVFIVVFLVGHVMNIGINVLGAYVHTNRLQYVEFFGKFYEGGGRAFEPYAAHTKYYKIKEEL